MELALDPVVHHFLEPQALKVEQQVILALFWRQRDVAVLVTSP
jgi:hypothetical protein